MANTRYLFYRYTPSSLILTYSDNYLTYDKVYIGYTRREAIRKFRQDNNLVGKHIKVLPLNFTDILDI